MMDAEESGSVAVDDGAEIAYTLRGPQGAPTLLFIPGRGATQLGYAADAEHFAGQGRRTLTFDLRGCGLSPGPPRVAPASFSIGRLAEDVIRLLDSLGLPTVDVVGHSMGGVIGLELIKQAPSRARSLITHGTAYQLHVSRFFCEALALFYRLTGPKLLAVLSARTGTAYGHNRTLIREMLSEFPVSVNNHIGRAIRKYDYRNVAAFWPGPILLIRGTLDRVINRHLPRTLAALEAKVNFHLADLEGAGHFTNLDKPREFREIMTHFLEQLDNGRSPVTGS